MSKFSPDVLKPGYSVPYPFGGSTKVDIQPTANGWWGDPQKVHQFLMVIGIDGTVEQACFHIGITTKQYKYFQRLHPEFKLLRKAYATILVFKAKQVLAKNITDNLNGGKIALKFLERKSPSEFHLPTIRRKSRTAEQKENTWAYKNEKYQEWLRTVGPERLAEIDRIATLGKKAD